MRELLQEALTDEGYAVELAKGGREGIDRVRQGGIDLVVTDVKMPDLDGLDALQEIRTIEPTPHVVVVTAFGSIETAIKAVKLGAYDYITKPFDVEDIELLVRRALDKRALEREVLYLRSALPRGVDTMVGRNVEMSRIYRLIAKIAPTAATVLVTGESGTGKELVARAIHGQSPRARRPFVAVNVAALPETLVESELFGHEKGAFTGAFAQRPGRFELAHSGTLFLDEIGCLRLELQTKLLRALQEREIERVGGCRAVPVDVRVVAATNVNLRQAVHEHRFREDLYYRLNVVPIAVPPLRERRDDIPLLLDHFLAKYAREFNRDVHGVSADALDVLVRYDWPGNVRELENIIQRSVLLAGGPVLQLQDLPLDLALPETGARRGELSLREAREQFERQYVLRMLERFGWNQSRAARVLGVHRNTLWGKLGGWGIRRPPGEDEPADVASG
jgi:two-component system, NtrC family, response regulator AtoC